MSSCYFLGPSPAKRLAERPASFDAVIVPGLPLQNGKWDTLLKTRIMWSLYLYKKGIARNIIFSGAAVHSPYTESKAMAVYARSLGLDAEHIFLDTLAEHSTENVYYSYQLSKKLGFKSLAIATDPFQCFMLDNYCKKNFSTKLYLLPVVYDSIRSYMATEPDIDMHAAYVNNFVSLEERSNYLQRLKGTLGNNIKTAGRQ
jgi:hypothetical protein